MPSRVPMDRVAHPPALLESERPLGDMLGILRELYRQASDVSDEEQMIERIRMQFPEQTRKLFDLHTRVTAKRLRKRRERLHPDGSADDEAAFQHMLRERELQDAESVLAENYLDWTLSTEGHPIYATKYGKSVFRRVLRSMLRQETGIEGFQRIAFAFFDGNGLKAMSDCTSYDNVTAYLQEVAKIFTSKEGRTRTRLEAEGIDITPMSIGGDEFGLLLCGKMPLAPQKKAIVASYQEEIDAAESLDGFLDFDDPGVLAKLQKPRAELPDKFLHSFSAGIVTLDEAIAELMADESQAESLRTMSFDDIRSALFDHLKRIAEAKQRQDKERYKASLAVSDPKSYALMLRNGENRSLEEENTRLRNENDLLRAQIAELLQQRDA